MKLKTIQFLLLAFVFVPAIVFGQENDFEVVEAGQKSASNTAVRQSPVNNNQVPKSTPTPLPTKNSKTEASKQRKGVADVQNAQMSATGNLPLRVEVSDMQPNALITLAVGAATRFHSEEKPTRLVIGNLTDIGVTKAGSQGWYGFYLRPVTGGISTNMFIEFASGATVMINLKTVNPKVLKPGDYNSEVFVKTAAVRDELINLRKDNEGLKNKVTQLNSQLTASKAAAAVPPPTNVSDPEMWKFLEQSSYLLKRDSTNFWKPVAVEKLKFTALSPLWEIKPGLGYVWIELENKGKMPITLQSIELLGGKAEIKQSASDLTVSPDKTLRFGIKIEVKSIEKNPLVLKFTTVDGKSFEQVLFGFANGIKAN